MMEKRFKDLIKCANAITDDDIEGAFWMMPSDVDPFLNALFNCIYDYRHPHKETRKGVKISEENIEKIVETLRAARGVWEGLK